MKIIYTFFLLMLLTLSGCVLSNSKAEEIAENAGKSTGGSIEVNAQDSVAQSGEEAVCETKYDEKSGGRAHNIKIAAGKLDGFEIAPGEVFSFNESLGPTGKSNGYKKARIFVLGKDAEGYGGGVCQLSSALYNCALDMGLSIVERHPHSKPVGYVPKDRDAATSYGGKDFKFENNLLKTLRIGAKAENGVLNISIASV